MLNAIQTKSSIQIYNSKNKTFTVMLSLKINTNDKFANVPGDPQENINQPASNLITVKNPNDDPNPHKLQLKHAKKNKKSKNKKPHFRQTIKIHRITKLHVLLHRKSKSYISKIQSNYVEINRI